MLALSLCPEPGYRKETDWDLIVSMKIRGIVTLIVCAFRVLQAGVGVTGASATSLKPIEFNGDLTRSAVLSD